MIPRPPRSTRIDTLFPYTTLFRSAGRLARALERRSHPPVGFRCGGACRLAAYGGRGVLLGRSRDSRPPLRLAALRAVLRALFRARWTQCAAHRGRGAAARLGVAPLATSRYRGAVGRVSYPAFLVLARAWPFRVPAVATQHRLGAP